MKEFVEALRAHLKRHAGGAVGMDAQTEVRERLIAITQSLSYSGDAREVTTKANLHALIGELASLVRGTVRQSMQIAELEARIKDLDAESLWAWGEYNNAQAEAGKWRVGQLALIAENLRLKTELAACEGERARLRADAERLDYISTERLIIFQKKTVEVCSEFGHGEAGTLREAIDAAKADE